MADAVGAMQCLDIRFLEHISHQPHAAMAEKAMTIGADNTGRLLTAMLLCIEAEIGQVGSFRVFKHTKNAAFIMEVIELRFSIIAMVCIGHWAISCYYR